MFTRAAVDKVVNEKVSHKRRELFWLLGSLDLKTIISHLKVNNPLFGSVGQYWVNLLLAQKALCKDNFDSVRYDSFGYNLGYNSADCIRWEGKTLTHLIPWKNHNSWLTIVLPRIFFRIWDCIDWEFDNNYCVILKVKTTFEMMYFRRWNIRLVALHLISCFFSWLHIV